MKSKVLDKPLDGRVALVTGAGRGIGRHVALAMARAGAKVAISSRTPAELTKVCDEIKAAGGTAAMFVADVSIEADVINMIQGTVDRFGRLDIVVNNAGIGVYGPLADTKTSDWDRIMAINARGPFLVCRESIPHLRKQKRTFILNITSVVGVKGYSNQSAYAASKHAVMGMTKVLAKEVQSDGIEVHAICPGGVDTDMATQARPDINRAELIAPEEIADIALFLVTRRGNAVIDEVHVRRMTATPWA